MAKLRSGILGKASGAIANVVTSSWKGINYARERVIPANPKSVSQSRVRGTLSSIVLIGRAVKTVFINTYWETLVKGTANSGWAKYVGTNQKAIQALEDYQNIKLATGNLESLSHLGTNRKNSENLIGISWSDETISNGSASDIVYAFAFVKERNFVYSQSSPATRASQVAEISIPVLSSVVGDVVTYVTAKKADGSLFSTTQGEISNA